MEASAAPGFGARGPGPLYAIFFTSGCAGLVYEVMWTRSFGLVFGSTTRAAAVVLAAFFLGMAGGNWLGARAAATSRAGALRRYAWVELAIAAGALVVLGWLRLYHAIFPVLYRATLDAPAELAALQLALVAIALGPPCMGMGATLPLMSRAVVSRERHVGQRLGFAYAVNTAGGVVGVLVSGFWLPVVVGVQGAMLLAAALNLAAALAALVAARGLAAEREPRDSEAEARPTPGGVALPFACVAAASGFGTLALEVLYTRLLGNVMDASVFSFALVLATFLVSLALGSALVSAIVDRLRSAWRLVALGASLGAVAILGSPWLLSLAWASAPQPRGFGGPLGAAALLLPFSCLVMGPPALLVGSVLPATWRAAIDRVGDTGAIVGRLAGLNTLAGVIGSLVTGFVLIPALGASRGILVVAALYALVAAFACLQLAGSPARHIAALGVLLGFIALASFRSWEILPLHLQPGERLLALEEGEGATVAVSELASDGERVRSLTLNGRYTLGASSGVDVHRSQGELALRLHGAPRDVAFIGVATGMSMRSIQGHPSIEHVVAMELFPGVLRLAGAFRQENAGVLEDPRVELRLADGRNHLFGTDRRFDVIVGDLFVPWHAGTGYLYTVEHFTNVRERLSDGGVFVQWLQADQVSVEELRSIAATFGDAFDDAELWLNKTQRGRPLLGLVGYRGRTPAAPRRQRIDAMTRVCGAAVLAGWSRSAPRNTDDFPAIEFSAAASHLVRTPAALDDVLAAVRQLRFEEAKRRAALPSAAALVAPAAGQRPDAVARARQVGVAGLVARVSRIEHAGARGAAMDARAEREDGLAAEHVLRVRGVRVGAEPLDGHEGRRGELDLAALVGLESLGRRDPTMGDDLRAADDHLACRVDDAQEEPGVEALRRDLGRDPARDRDQTRGGEIEPGLLVRLAHGGAQRALARARLAGDDVARFDLAAGKHPGARLAVARGALEQEELEAGRGAASRRAAPRRWPKACGSAFGAWRVIRSAGCRRDRSSPAMPCGGAGLAGVGAHAGMLASRPDPNPRSRRARDVSCARTRARSRRRPAPARLRRLPPGAARGDRAAVPRRPDPARGAHGRGQEPHLPAPGAAAPRHHARRLAARRP